MFHIQVSTPFTYLLPYFLTYLGTRLRRENADVIEEE